VVDALSQSIVLANVQLNNLTFSGQTTLLPATAAPLIITARLMLPRTRAGKRAGP